MSQGGITQISWPPFPSPRGLYLLRLTDVFWPTPAYPIYRVAALLLNKYVYLLVVGASNKENDVENAEGNDKALLLS